MSTSGNESDAAPPVENAVPPLSADVTPSVAAPENIAVPENSDDEFLDYEPLSPEIVEEEAMRGDFVLTWAVVLLAFLLGSTKVADSATLVHVKTGQYLASHGFWPPANDVFSYTAAERPWVNLGWGFDLLLAAVYSVAGAAGLSLLKALAAAIAFWCVVHISRPGIPTWWTSICAVLAVLACQSHFVTTPDLVTLLGVSLTLWLVHDWQLQTQSVSEQPRATQPGKLWRIVPLFFVWSNFDPRMFLGLALLVCLSAGESLETLLKRTASGRARSLWIVTAACFGVALLNPFGWKSLTAPWLIYGAEYPAIRAYVSGNALGAAMQSFPMTTRSFWTHLDTSAICALFLMVSSAILFVMNWSRLVLGQLLVFLAFVVFAVLAIHELAVCSIVFAVLAAINGQAWYAASCRQTYSIESSELLFSRGGRAVTVLAFTATAYFGASGYFKDATAPRTGYGFDYNLSSNLEDLGRQLQLGFDDRPFNLMLSQGDMLIWLGQKPFADNRVALFHGEGDADILSLQVKLRDALRMQKGDVVPGGNTGFWRPNFDKFRITHVMPRLTGVAPDYLTLLNLLHAHRYWKLTSFGSATANF